MNKTKQRKARLKDFAERKRSDPSSVYHVDMFGWDYINIHPMANETEVLHRIGVTPNDCNAVDCYWQVDEDVVLLKVFSNKYLKDKPPGLYAGWWMRNIPILNLFAYMDEPAISKEIIENVMQKFYSLELSSERFSQEKLGEQVTLIESSRV